MKESRFADRLDAWLPPTCPGCGAAMPGLHARYCPVRAATIRAERVATDEKTREAFTRLLQAVLGHKTPGKTEPQ